MKSIASLSRIGAAAALVLALGSACGGQSFSGRDDGDGGSSNAGTSQGGTTSHAGTHSTAGKAQGGTHSAGSGGMSVTAGTGGVGGDSACNAPPESGQCDAAFQRWYHDPVSNTCQQFIWGGCGGNANRYDSQAACEAACPGPVNIYSCKLPSDCFVTSPGCCGVCDGPNLTSQNFVAYNKQYAGIRCGGVADTIPQGGSGAGFPAPAGGASNIGAPIACPPCAAPLPGQGTLKYFVPDCVMNQCVVTDLRTSDVTACKSSEDCRLRSGTSCCEGCGNDYVAVRKDGSFEKLVCSAGPVACDACAPVPPSGASAWCNPSTSHCEVQYSGPTGGAGQ